MGEHFPSGGLPQTVNGDYERGDYSAAEQVTVASASGSNDEKHASGSYGAAPEILGGLVRRAGVL